MTAEVVSLDINHPLSFDLTNQAFYKNPYPVFATMRDAGPVIPVKMPMLGKIWVTTTHAATQAALKDNGLFVLEGKNAGSSKGNAAMAWWMPKSLRLLTNNMLGKDEPDHRRLRKLVDQAFGRRGILEMRPGIDAIADRLLDGMEGREEVDILSEYTRLLPLEVISDLLGLPDTDRQKFADWAGGLTSVNNPLAIFGVLGTIKKMTAYLRGQIEEVRRSPRPGIISELVRAEEDGDKLNADELVAMVFLLLFAGFETTTHMIAGSIIDLDQNPDQKAWLFADPEARMEKAVEELARHVSSVQGTKPRFVARDAEFFGQRLKRGDKMMALPAAGNADPAVFDEPETLKLDRFPNPHLVFSSGIHFCLGLQLARVETQSALTRLYARFPDLQLANLDRLEYRERIGTRTVKTLPVRLNGVRQTAAA